MRFMGGCEQTETFLRLFLIPGVHHGRGGPGLTEFDAFNALEKWVERGPPPKLIACHRDNGVIERCRPVFPYPDVGSLFRQTRSEGGREFRALRLLPALSSFCGSCSMRLDSGRIVGISGQFLPVLIASRMMDVLWSDLHMRHESRSSKSDDPSYRPFHTT
jgi:tannase/feruloyl esterase